MAILRDGVTSAAYMLHFADIFTNEYIVQDVPPDGNCMFSSLAIALNRTTSSAGEVRKEIVEFIRGHMQEVCVADEYREIIGSKHTHYILQ